MVGVADRSHTALRGGVKRVRPRRSGVEGARPRLRQRWMSGAMFGRWANGEATPRIAMRRPDSRFEWPPIGLTAADAVEDPLEVRSEPGLRSWMGRHPLHESECSRPTRPRPR